MRTITITFLFSILLIPLLSSCGEKTTNKETTIEKATEQPSSPIPTQKKKENLVNAEDFSKAFSTTTATEEPADTNIGNTKTNPVDNGSRYFTKGILAKHKFSNDDFQSNTPPQNSLAGKIENKEKYSWLPNWDFSSKGGVRLPDADLSPDKSLIALIDNVSSPESNTSSLIVLINTYNFKINAIYFFSGKFFTKVRFVKGKKELIVWEKIQDEAGGGRLHCISLKNGKIKSSTEHIKALSVSFAVNEKRGILIVKTSNDNKKIYLFKISDLTQTPESLKCSQTKGTVAVSPDLTRFALAGSDGIEVFKFSDNMRLKFIKTKTENIPDSFIFISNDIFATLSYSNPLYIVAEDKAKSLCPQSGRKLFYRKDINSIVFEKYIYKAIAVINLKTFETTGSFVPQKLKPKTLGDAVLIGYLPHLKKYIVLDDQGNMALYYRPGRRWHKKAIFTRDMIKK